MKPELREKIIAEWRGIGIPPIRPDRVVSVGKVLEKLLPSLGIEGRVEEEAVKRIWKDLVGDFIAANAAPSGIKNGCLMVRVAHPTLRYDLETVWKPRILETLQNHFGKSKIRSLRFVI